MMCQLHHRSAKYWHSTTLVFLLIKLGCCHSGHSLVRHVAMVFISTFNWGGGGRLMHYELFCFTSHFAHVAPNDYVALNAMLVFTSGQTVGDVACANLDIVNDTAVERDGEDIILLLSPVEPAVTVVTASSTSVVIDENNNDGKLKINNHFKRSISYSVCCIVNVV